VAKTPDIDPIRIGTRSGRDGAGDLGPASLVIIRMLST